MEKTLRFFVYAISACYNPLLYNSCGHFCGAVSAFYRSFSSVSPLFCVFFAQSMSKLWQARFFTTVNHLRDLPKTQVSEIAFAGRSNAGKSTAINILCNQKGLAFASKTPGRTQHINYFSIGGAHVGQHRKDATRIDEIEGLLVDLPGYGYAEVSGGAKWHWQELLGDYVQQRQQLAALVLIMDSRRPFTELDIQMLEWFAPTGKPIHCILTKVDKLNRNESTQAMRMARTLLASYVDANGQPFPFTVQLFSALKRVGIEEANLKILELLGLNAPASDAESAPDADAESAPDSAPDSATTSAAETTTSPLDGSDADSIEAAGQKNTPHSAG